MSGSDEQPLGYLLHRLATSLRADVTARVLEPLELSFPQYICLRILSRSPGRSNAELARDVMVSPQAMNIVVRGLQDRGFVSRPAEVSAGRSRPAELTAAGRAVLKRTDDGIRQAEDHVLAPLGERDRRELRRILAALA
ncbi:DNA-binding MarR family transcriptional regulator [Mycolicibacterium iranicum]|uniref:DNA-binding MarR family transcriptional regulator n=2 Tax=Mycolicibacterium iranicum TaxID=912594 RepID=A0A839Q557_MYCIR|nr:DNA-binding MarR family transcriptional regulator [Mycolicibacterium iranicum]